MVKFIVKKERVGPVRGRHPWVFSGALKNIPEGLTGGTPVTLVDEAGNFLARGYFNSYSQIAVRLWSWDETEKVDEDFFVRRVEWAYNLRKKFVDPSPSVPLPRREGIVEHTNAYRLIHGENDLLPGLIVDKYADYLAVQFHTSGIAVWQKEIIAALVKVIKPKGIYEREPTVLRDRPARVGVQNFEPLPLRYGDMPARVEIVENGHKFFVDIIGGQKTGFFLDQRDKRLALTKYVKDKKVLNCFSYTGGFSVYALGAGASTVVSVDASREALELAEENVKLNQKDDRGVLTYPLDRAEFILADVKEYLQDAVVGAIHELPLQQRFDVIILDPPAFVKDRHKIKEGLQGYRKINEMALRVLPPGGILLTCSCSAHVSLQDFRFMLTEAASRAGRTVQILETYTHGIDHPELVAFTEGEYLKCIFVEVI